MFERYTERARRVLFFARYEASQLASRSIETEHLLLGLVREGKGLTSRIFAASGLSAEEIRKKIQGSTAAPEYVVAGEPDETIPFSAETKRVLELASEEADRLLHNYVGSEHLLLGILRVERSTAASILMENGLRLRTVRDDIVLRLLHEDTTLPRAPEGKPDFPPSYDVRIAPTTRREEQGTLGNAGPDYWMRRGVDLKAIIAEVYGVDERRIDLADALDSGARYDFVLVLPKPESRETIDRLVQEAIEKHFRLTVTRENRSTNVHVLKAPNGVKGAKLLDVSELGGGAMVSFSEFQVDTRIRPLPAMSDLLRKGFSGGAFGAFGSGTTITDFCRGLEQNFGRFFVDETGLTGIYDQLALRSSGDRFEDVLQALGDQLGLVATPEWRDVTMLVIRQT